MRKDCNVGGEGTAKGGLVGEREEARAGGHRAGREMGRATAEGVFVGTVGSP